MEFCEYFWPFKKTLINFVTSCYLDSNSKQVLSDQDESGVKNLWLIVEVIVNDMLNITEHITNEEEVVVRLPSNTLSTLKQEALDFLIYGVIPFFKLLLKRKRVTIHQ